MYHVKWLRNLVKLFFRNPDASVPDGKTVSLLRDFSRDRNQASRLGSLAGVVDQIDQNGLDQIALGTDASLLALKRKWVEMF